MLTPSQDCKSHTRPSADLRTRQALWIALLISAVFMIAEVLGAYWTDSLALMADAGHMLTDVGALALSLFAVWIASRPATPQKTYGYYRVEIFAALLNGIGLVAISLAIVYQSYSRLQQPHEVLAGPMLAIAALGLIANAACAMILYHAHSDSLNVKGALLHVLGDALGSVAAMVAGVCMLFWNWYLADPIASLLVSVLIFYGAWRILKDSVDILLEGTPAHIDICAMERELATVEGVASIHDLHVWSINSGMISMSCHAVVTGQRNRQELLSGLNAVLRSQFRVDHSTIQLEELNTQSELAEACGRTCCGFAGIP
jgi:cobalt-zinc-cadmium efflux system protein